MTNMVTPEYLKFQKRFNQIQKVIPYNPLWCTGTGYFDYAVGFRDRDGVPPVRLEPGEEVKCISELPNNRKMIFIGTPYGTLLIFERYTDGKYGVIAYNASMDLTNMSILHQGYLSDRDMDFVFGFNFKDNIGSVLAEAKEVFAELQ